MPIPIPRIREMDADELADLRHALADRVQVFYGRAAIEGPNADRDANCAAYEGLLAAVDAERERRTLRSRALSFAGAHEAPDMEAIAC